MIVLTYLIFVLLFCCRNSIAEDGHCIWYGECGPDTTGHITNCYDNGTARLLTDTEALQIMKSVCSMFYNGPDATYTCCAPDQIRTLSDQLFLAKILFGTCPSCYYNYRSLFCATTCHPQQSRFITVDSVGDSTLYPGKKTVQSITSVLADDFPQRLLDSCRDVIYPGGYQHSLDTICGRPYDKCTKEALLRYIGVENPQVAFPTYFNLTNNTALYNYYNQSTFSCNQPVETSYEHQPMCKHSDCPKSPPAPIPPDVPGKFSNASLRMIQLIIVPDNQTFVEHDYLSPPAPFVEYSVGPALELGFLTQVLELQKNIINLEARLPSNNRTVRLTDVCLKPTNQSCAIFSVFQYFQNSYENLMKNMTDDFGIVLADYLTHIFLCSNSWYSFNDTLLNTSCFADFGGLISSQMVLGNYPSTKNALSARSLIITLVLEDSNDPERTASAEAWEENFLNYMQNFTDTQNSLRTAGRFNEIASFTVYYTNEHAIKRELNNMIWANNQSNIPSLALNSFQSTSFSGFLIFFMFIVIAFHQV